MFRKLAGAGLIAHIAGIILISLIYLFTPQVEFKTVSDPEPTAPLGQWIYNLFISFPAVAGPLMILAVIALSVAVNAILIRHEIIPRQSYFPAVIALILLLFTPDAHHLMVTLSCMTLLLFSLHNVMNLYGEQYPYNKVLNATISVSLASMISPPVIVFGIFVWLGFFTFRINSWREWVISLMGLVLPYFYLALMYLWNDNLFYAFRLYEKLLSGFSFTIFRPGVPEFIFIGILSLWALISATRYLGDTTEKVISIRKKMWILSHFTLIALLTALLSGSAFLVMLPLVFLPLSSIIAYAAGNARRAWIHDAMLLLIMAVILYNRLNS